MKQYINQSHYVKSVSIWSYSGPHFPAFGLNRERYSVALHIQSKCGKIWTRITPYRETFYAVSHMQFYVETSKYLPENFGCFTKFSLHHK